MLGKCDNSIAVQPAYRPRVSGLLHGYGSPLRNDLVVLLW